MTEQRSDGTSLGAREYIQITPTTDSLSSTTLLRQLERLHSLETERPATGILSKLTGPKREPMTIEVLLVAPGSKHPELEYYIGCSDQSQLETLKRICDQLFPRSYECTRTDLTLDEIEAQPATGIEFVGRAERRNDWQMRLTPYTAFQNDEEEITPPLASAAATLAASPHPAVYQALLTPKADYTVDAGVREIELKQGRDTPAQRIAADLFPSLESQESHTESSSRRSETRNHSGKNRDYGPSVRSRLEDLAEKDPHSAFAVNARAVIFEADTGEADTETERAGTTDGDVPAVEAHGTAADGAGFKEIPSAVDGSSVEASPAEGDTPRFEADTAETDAETGEASTEPSESRHLPTETDTRVADTPESNASASETPTPTDSESLSPTAAGRELASAFGHVGGDIYTIDARSGDGEAIWDDIVAQKTKPMNYDRLYTKLPGTANRSSAIIADAAECAVFGFFGGDSLPAVMHQAIGPTPSEQAALEPPSTDQLATYRTTGLTLGHLEHEEQNPPLAIPPSLQPLHAAWFGPTGSGKSVSLTTAGLDSHAATEGADIYLLPKGDGMASEYLRSHFARYGSLDDVYYFDCSRVIPAISFFDIRADLEAGIPRETAVEDRVDHYLELVRGLMVGFDDAKRSPDVIRYLIRALFDPVHGQDAFSHRELYAAASRMRERQAAPAVSDGNLHMLLTGVVATAGDVFDAIMQGVLTRIDKVAGDPRLALLFNHVSHPETEPRFDLREHIDSNTTILLDTGGLRESAQRALSLVILSNLWTALRRRATLQTDFPLVNCYIEEAATVAETELVSELLSQGRAFGLSITLAMQFPAQLHQTDPRAYQEVLNNIGTIITGRVGHDTALAERLATDDMPPGAVANRLRGLRRGQWLAALPSPFGSSSPRPFIITSATPPVGHDASDEPLTGSALSSFELCRYECQRQTTEQAGLRLAEPRVTGQRRSPAPEGEPTSTERRRVDTALPYTRRLPAHLEYDPDRHAICCTGCEARYAPTASGMERACSCHPEGEIDPDDIPICAVNLRLTPTEREATGWSDAQLMFLQTVYNAQQLEYEPPGYDLLNDSMLRLPEYIGIDAEAVDELLDAELLRHDTDHPHRLYSITSDGRHVIDQEHRRGVAHGHRKGDLGESTQHIFGVEVGRRWLKETFVDDPDSPASRVVTYYEPDHIPSGHSRASARLDIVALDDDDEVVIAVEVERINHDIAEAVPADYDKMAALEPEEAIWIVMSQSAGHDVLQALNAPDDTGSPRIEKTYAETTPPQQFRIDAPGATGIYPVDWLRSQLTQFS